MSASLPGSAAVAKACGGALGSAFTSNAALCSCLAHTGDFAPPTLANATTAIAYQTDSLQRLGGLLAGCLTGNSQAMALGGRGNTADGAEACPAVVTAQLANTCDQTGVAAKKALRLSGATARTGSSDGAAAAAAATALAPLPMGAKHENVTFTRLKVSSDCIGHPFVAGLLVNSNVRSVFVQGVPYNGHH